MAALVTITSITENDTYTIYPYSVSVSFLRSYNDELKKNERF